MTWDLMLFLHLAAMALFVGGQLAVALAVAPVHRREGTDAAMRSIAMRFGIATAVALVLLGVTGIALASHEHLWHTRAMHEKLGAIAVLAVLVVVHIVRPRVRGLSLTVMAVSLVVVWLGVRLT